MKRISILIIAGAAVLATSCNKYLDINTNPNQAVSTTPELIIPQALTGTASLLNQFNTYGLQIGGYGSNAGGYGGFGTAFTYNFTSADYNGLWSSGYDNLEDYQTVINQTNSQQPAYSYANGVARIMRVIGFEQLVNAYNSVPYTNALQGDSSLTPTYTDPLIIYKDLADQLDIAIAAINKGIASPGVAKELGSTDVLFKGDMVKWKQLANTVKLRLLLYGAGKVTFTNSTITSDGFLTTDALINPGYARDNSRQNPKWDRYGFSSTGSDVTKSWIPSTFIMSFYNGIKLQDSGRGKAIYYLYAYTYGATPPAANTPTLGTGQLGVENVNNVKCPSGSFWYPGTNRAGTSAGNATGTLKGPNAAYPLLTAAESYFLQAEGALKGLVTGTSAATSFSNGIAASYKYLYLLPDGTTSGNPTTDAAKYMTDNAGNRLVDYSAATTDAQRLEAIITQKYIAMNMVNSEVGWNDYRRTHYPTISGTSATSTFASTVSESTRADKLPVRLMYPAVEGALNSVNVPKSLSPFTSLVFWAL
ncbi:MAG: SusD/RagB family nutrient-binding outer membrane lipoprotein [Chitinophagaceae bacterium]